jgi:hypothetical protein
LYNNQQSNTIPRCLLPRETVDHVLQCPPPKAASLWEDEIQQLDVYLGFLRSDPDLVRAICSSLRAWHNQLPLPAIQTTNPVLRRAIQEQDRIGWRSFLDGFQSTAWHECQELYFNHIRLRRSSIKWKSQVTRRIWQIDWNMWTHRNSILHSCGQSTHQSEMPHLALEFRNEYHRGSAGLSVHHRHLFTRPLTHP